MMVESTDEPGEVVPDHIREFAYIDSVRIRALAADLAGGLLSSVHEQETKDGLKIGANALIKAEKTLGASRQSGTTTSRDLDSLYCAAFEEDAVALGFMKDISVEVQDSSIWESGAIGKIAPPFRVIRITAPTFLADHRATIETFSEFAARFAQAGADIFPIEFQKIIQAMGSTLTDAVTVRIEPVSLGLPHHGFFGVLESQYIEHERSAIPIRYGYDPVSWTTIAIVTRYPARESFTADQIVKQMVSMTPQGEQGVDSAQMATLMRLLGKFTAGTGFSEDVVWPGGAITPVAIYRPITKHA
ncbi:DUF6414 family protein [Glycomyces niveus]|uniref:Uncharacterized protein n=1 Tax=Glycomyces niveus TaxID=2820287 RepID=A0ABS3U4L3_9ACTN|nr:hypothetical protein [Glycomyces sp. NEAU-S30]MBO3733717.1 hypothetical protein [Glycomyces sp. NEAU-S30]